MATPRAATTFLEASNQNHPVSSTTLPAIIPFAVAAAAPPTRAAAFMNTADPPAMVTPILSTTSTYAVPSSASDTVAPTTATALTHPHIAAVAPDTSTPSTPPVFAGHTIDTRTTAAAWSPLAVTPWAMASLSTVYPTSSTTMAPPTTADPLSSIATDLDAAAFSGAIPSLDAAEEGCDDVGASHPYHTSRRAFIVGEGDDGLARRLAYGECCMDEGIFSVHSVMQGADAVDVGGLVLSSMNGGLIALDDLDVAELDLEWEEEGAGPDSPVKNFAHGDGEKYPKRSRVDSSCQTSPTSSRWPAGATDIRVRLQAGSKLLMLPEVVSHFSRKRERIPVLIPTEEVRKEQRKTSVYKDRAADAVSDYAAAAARLHEAHVKHLAREAELERQLQEQQQRHEEELREIKKQQAALLSAALAAERDRCNQNVMNVKAWAQILHNGWQQQHKEQAARQLAAAERRAATKSKRVATWHAKRNNISRTLQRLRAKKEQASQQAQATTADLQALQLDNTALSAELGQCIRVAEQRMHEGERTAFTFQTILRDLLVRQHALNAGAAHVREITGIYSQRIAADGRDLELESGSRRSVLRWEKIADVLCMQLEGRQLRNAMRSQPRTRFWAYVDLSPDCRAVEQFGMGIEYAGVTYVFSDEADAVTRSRINGHALAIHDHAQLGSDGCPIVNEWTKRIFTPMLEALGPKYAATADCFLRTLQVYGSTTAQLLSPAFTFASVECAAVPVPLIDCMEGIVSDAGGEVHKSGGVLETCAPPPPLPPPAWRHCSTHCLNLALEKSIAFERVGANIRSISSFCRGGNKHKMLVLHMKYIQQPELGEADAACDQRRCAMYREAHKQLLQCGQFHEALGGQGAQPEAFSEQLHELELIDNSKIERKSKKGTDVRWKYECEVVDDRLLDVAHLLAPAILIEYGVGEEYSHLRLNEEKHKTACATLALLVDPAFIFWATHLRLLYTLVYKGAFDAAQYNHHHNAPAMAGSDGLPIRWAEKLRAAVVKPSRAASKPCLEPSNAAPLLALLDRHPCLKDEATAAANDFLAQADHIEFYFKRWDSLEALVHAVALEVIIQGPLTEVVCQLAAKNNLEYWAMLPRMPSPAAIRAAKLGMSLFQEATVEERDELPGTLAWLLFSPKTRDGTSDNTVFHQLVQFAAAEVNPVTRQAYPYRCWYDLTQVLVAGGAKYCPTTSAQLESLFTGLTRQQGASKVHISQQQVSFESRSGKNETMASLTEKTLSDGWADAKAVKAAIDSKGFWACSIGIAADRRLSQKLNEDRKICTGEDDNEEDVLEAGVTYDVEKIVGHQTRRGVIQYIVKWVGFPSSDNTWEPEEHLLTCKPLITYWLGKKNQKEMARVKQLQEAALREKRDAEIARTSRRVQSLDATMEDPPCSKAAPRANLATPRPAHVPTTCKMVYDHAHERLKNAICIAFDTKASSTTGCIYNLGWIIAGEDGVELASYHQILQLPKGERIHSKAFKAHGISMAEVVRDGHDTKPELGEFIALIVAAIANKVRIVVHNASFQVARVNHTAHQHAIDGGPLCSADMLCAMHNATKHCARRVRRTKRPKAPQIEELYSFLHGHKPTLPMRNALADCQITLASYLEGHCRRWW